ncbi:hypothetical protein BJP25_11645 [Actinokineospora bangkokensis]|uniref:Uncharacterized protein n=1 Tax=Actinokineospora bangkokensis TaxID=1193682 RepID=A0A1Q9LQT2_9PSEU|nr:hypothetical protein BJP25_11645 [Actinokineospora bangkokensis]
MMSWWQAHRLRSALTRVRFVRPEGRSRAASDAGRMAIDICHDIGDQESAKQFLESFEADLRAAANGEAPGGTGRDRRGAAESA